MTFGTYKWVLCTNFTKVLNVGFFSQRSQLRNYFRKLPSYNNFLATVQKSGSQIASPDRHDRHLLGTY